MSLALRLCVVFLALSGSADAQEPTISSFNPSSGPHGTLVTVSGSDLTGPSSLDQPTVSLGTTSQVPTKLAPLVGVAYAQAIRDDDVAPPLPPDLYSAIRLPDGCPPTGPLLVIAEGSLAADGQATHLIKLQALKDMLERENALVILGPGVDLDFSIFPGAALPIFPMRCTRIIGVADVTGLPQNSDIVAPTRPTEYEAARRRSGLSAELTWDWRWVSKLLEARSPQRAGPLVRYGPTRKTAPGKNIDNRILFWNRCDSGARDHFRASGFRLYGPSFADQWTEEIGILSERCLDIEISNMEIAGWGGAGVSIKDRTGPDAPCDVFGEDRAALPGRVRLASDARILRSYFHHNRHPQEANTYRCSGRYTQHYAPGCVLIEEGVAGGYGVNVGQGAWAQIVENVFDDNRHAIATPGDVGGYEALRNLVLKGGGYHGTTFIERTHMFDVHGTGCWWSDDLCGTAGHRHLFIDNAFQYVRDKAIKLRGIPRDLGTLIDGNVFAHDSVNDALEYSNPWPPFLPRRVTVGTNNQSDYDSFGKYGICDFDGDGADDLFLPTGVTWWYSAGGKRQWSYLGKRGGRITDLKFAYVDNDRLCDVIGGDDQGRWYVSYNGRADWVRLGTLTAPFNDVAFGRFALSDHPRPARRTTHAFWRDGDGNWRIAALNATAWSNPIQNSVHPMDRLRFADINGDGTTDVVTVAESQVKVSYSGRESWFALQPFGGSPTDLRFADVDGDDAQDILKIEVTYKSRVPSPLLMTYHWSWSGSGRTDWRVLKSYEWSDQNPLRTPPLFAGQFGPGGRGATLSVGPSRYGEFHTPATEAGWERDDRSAFPY